ncbi:rRNA maturation RNase YbeY [Hydrogenophaga sp.]|uniref:rRNA maturation RNase YbeY n=1 Tax=Hydrogenophaga sp. TaxID=1904254 RepID=UPI0019A8B4A0|nr:rRNA maturation RNase YbeY [Hydrogenophaga sp.]MBD3893554.1 rRNA maturation RNase YbeY [Hydrogenophaga sp.]
MPLPHLALSLQFSRLSDAAPHRTALARWRVARWLRHALESDAEIAVRVVDADEGRALNRDYRGKDYATNVLTFDYARQPLLMADLVLCAPVVAQEAEQLGIALQAHYAHLLVHGTLHAQGHEHESNESDALAMEALESQLLLRLGFADPYPALR